MIRDYVVKFWLVKIGFGFEDDNVVVDFFFGDFLNGCGG